MVASQCHYRLFNGPFLDPWWRCELFYPHGTACRLHLAIMWEDEGGDLTRLDRSSSYGLCPITSHRLGGFVATNPIRDRACNRLDVACERRIRRQMPSCLVTDQINDRRTGTLGIVKISDAVCQSHS